MNTEQEAYRISSIKVEGLFGMFDHEIPLNLDERITIIYGENGIGKTMIFRILRAFGDGDFETLKTYPFKRLEICFKNEIKIIAVRQLIQSRPTLGIEGFKRLEEPFFSHIVEWKKEFDLRDYVSEMSSHELEKLQNEFLWHLANSQGGREGKLDSKLSNFRAQLREISISAGDFSSSISKRMRSRMLLSRVLEPYKKELQEFLNIGKREPLPPDLDQLLACIRVSMIETNRLFSDLHEFDELMGESILRRIDAVDLLSRELADTIKEAQRKYQEKNDELESSIRSRLLEPGVQTSFEAAELKSIARDVASERGKLIEVGLLAEQEGSQGEVIEEGLSDIKKAILGFNLLDMQKKLAVFDENNLYTKLRLFLDIINERRFSFKKLKINPKSGFVFENVNKEILRRTDLSSGEQHELVLLYNLIFLVPENSLILIDEPEISLHVVWQKEFLADMEEIIRLRKFDLVIATHSPFIIDDRWELTVALKGIIANG